MDNPFFKNYNAQRVKNYIFAPRDGLDKNPLNDLKLNII